MIAMMSSTHSDLENTMNTIQYADRVKEFYQLKMVKKTNVVIINIIMFSSNNQ